MIYINLTRKNIYFKSQALAIFDAILIVTNNNLKKPTCIHSLCYSNTKIYV